MHKCSIPERLALFIIAVVGVFGAHHLCASVHQQLSRPLLYPGQVVCQQVNGGSICYTPFCPSTLPPSPGVQARTFNASSMIAWGKCGLGDFLFHPTPAPTPLVGWMERLSQAMARILNYLLFGTY